MIESQICNFFYFPLCGEEVWFASVVWELSRWVVPTAPICVGAVSTQGGAGQKHEALE